MSTVNIKTVFLMHRIGGAFAKKLAELWVAADEKNKLTLESAFSDYFDRYEAITNE